MHRRTFLRICSGVVITAAVGGSRLLLNDDHLDVDGRALFPGVPLGVEVDDDVPAGASLRIVVRHDGTPYSEAWRPALGGASERLETPYPFEGLVPGTYLVHVELTDRRGHTVERHDVGGYRLGRHRFSS